MERFYKGLSYNNFRKVPNQKNILKWDLGLVKNYAITGMIGRRDINPGKLTNKSDGRTSR